MSSTPTRARHRSATRPATPLTSLAKTVSAVDTRKGLLAAAATGIAISVVAGGSALASPDAQVEAQGTTVPATNLGDVVSQAHMTVAANPEVKAPDTNWSEGEVVVPTAEAPAAQASHSNTAGAATRSVHAATTPAPAAAVAAPAAAVAPAAAAATSIAPSVAGGSVLDIAMRYQGVPYVYGGTSPRGFDCSGFVQYVYGQSGVGLPRTSWAQGSAGHKISAGEAQQGDIVYYGGHVGIYAGNGMMVHAPKPGESVKVQKIYGNPSFVRVGN